MDDPKKKLKTQLKHAVFSADPSKAMHAEAMQHTDLLESIENKLGEPLKIAESEETKKEKQRVAGIADFVQGFLQSIKGEKGDKGDKGDPSTVPGPKGDKGDKGEDSQVPGPQGDTGPQGKAIVGPAGPKGDKGDSIVGSPGPKGDKGDMVAVKDIVDYLIKNRSLDISHLKNGQQLASAAAKMGKIDTSDLRWHGGGMSSSKFVSGEVVAGSGTTWTLANTPRLFLGLYAQGQRLSTARGDYTISGANITTAQSWNAGDIEADYYK